MTQKTRVVPQFMNLMCSTIWEKKITLCETDGHSHVCHPVQSADETKLLPNVSVREPNCLQTKAFVNQSTTINVFAVIVLL